MEQKQLKSAYEEMVSVMSLTDDDGSPIKLSKKATEQELIALLQEAIECIDTTVDEFSEETEEVIEFVKNGAKKGKPAKAEKKAPVKEVEEDEEEIEEEDEDEDEDIEEEIEEVPIPKKVIPPPAKKSKAPAKVEEEDEDDDEEEEIEEEEIEEEEEELPKPKASKKQTIPAPKEKKAAKSVIDEPVEENKPAKKFVHQRNSAFAQALEILATDPFMSLEKLKKLCEKKGVDTTSNGVRSAHIMLKRSAEVFRKAGVLTEK